MPNKYFLNQDGVWEPHDVHGSSVIDTNFIRPQPPLPEVKEGEVGRDEKENDGGRIVEERESEEGSETNQREAAIGKRSG